MKTFIILISILLIAVCTNKPGNENIFYQNWDQSPKSGALRMDDWIVWGVSVIKDEDGK